MVMKNVLRFKKSKNKSMQKKEKNTKKLVQLKTNLELESMIFGIIEYKD